MPTQPSTRVCPFEIAGGLDNSIRRFLQNPQKILCPFISKGMTVLDIGCGPGYFSIAMAQLLSGEGKVIAADLQDGMLEKIRQKIKGTNLEQIIELHKCGETSIGVTENVDFILAFYMIHEVPDRDKFLKQLFSILKPDGKMFIVEPKIHVSPKAFESMVEYLTTNGLEILERPKVFFSRTIVIRKRKPV